MLNHGQTFRVPGPPIQISRTCQPPASLKGISLDRKFVAVLAAAQVNRSRSYTSA